MKVSQFISMVRDNELSNMSATGFTDQKIMNSINLGIIELSKRFRLATKAESIRTSPYTHVYSLRNTDVINILEIYDSKGKTLVPQQVLDDEDYDYRLLSSNSFLLKRKVDYDVGITYTKYKSDQVENIQKIDVPDFELMVVYSAIAEPIETVEDNLTIPILFVDALMAYVGYKATSTLGANATTDNNNTWKRFEYCCSLISNSSYASDEAIVLNSIQSKGFK